VVVLVEQYEKTELAEGHNEKMEQREIGVGGEEAGVEYGQKVGNCASLRADVAYRTVVVLFRIQVAKRTLNIGFLYKDCNKEFVFDQIV